MRARAWVLLAALVTPGCPRPARPTLPPTVAREALTPQQRLERAQALVAPRQRLSAVAQVRGIPGLGGLNVTADVFAERPGRLYLAARSFFGPPTDEIWTDGKVFLWRSMRPGGGARGPATREALSRLLPVPLPPSQWVGLLLGLPLPDEPPTALRACGDCPASLPCPCVMLSYDDGTHVELWVDDGGRVEQARLTSEDGRIYRVRYATPGEGGLATELWIEEQGRPQPARVLLTEVSLNGPSPPDALFAPLNQAAEEVLLPPDRPQP